MPLPEEGRTAEQAVYDSAPQFNPYEPESLAPDTIAPPPTAPVEQAEPVSESKPEPQEPPLPEFDPRYREEFTGLLYLGRLEESVTLFGHRFVLRTPTTDQMATIALLVKPYQSTKVEHAVYQTAVVAASVLSVDGRPLPGSLGPDPEDDLRTKFEYVMANWMPAVREVIYERCFALELTVRRVLDSLGGASG